MVDIFWQSLLGLLSFSLSLSLARSLVHSLSLLRPTLWPSSQLKRSPSASSEKRGSASRTHEIHGDRWGMMMTVMQRLYHVNPICREVVVALCVCVCLSRAHDREKRCTIEQYNETIPLTFRQL